MGISCEGLISREMSCIIHSFSKFEPICNVHAEKETIISQNIVLEEQIIFLGFIVFSILKTFIQYQTYFVSSAVSNLRSHVIIFFLFFLIDWIPVKESLFKR